MSKRLSKMLPKPIFTLLQEAALIGRALPMVGRRYHCPCCGWSFRNFIVGGTSLRSKLNGYCPRCNSKPRHRWLWRFLQGQRLLGNDGRILHLSPAYSMARCFRKQSFSNYFSADLLTKSNIHFKMNLSDAPFPAHTFQAIICLHVLEHVKHDKPAIRHLYRITKPGGWVLIGVPIRLDQKTYEDATITTPEARKEAFGEKDHYRFYGYDLLAQLETIGFEVEMYKAADLKRDVLLKYGLKCEEVMFLCKK